MKKRNNSGHTERLKKVYALLKKHDFQTIHNRTKSVLQPMKTGKGVDIDIAPNFRPEKTILQFSNFKRFKKVLVVDRNFKRLGSHISLSEIILPLQDRLKGLDMDLQLACLDPQGNLTEIYKKSFEIHELRQFPLNMSLSEKYENEVFELSNELSSFEPDLIYANSVDMFPVIDAARLSGIPSIWNIREAQDWRLRFADRHPDIIARALACFAYPRSLIFVSQASKENWVEFIQEKNSHVVRTAIKPNQFINPNLSLAESLRSKLGIAKDDIMLLTVGTICDDKGQIDAANAMSKLPVELREKIHWVFLGNSDKSYIRRLKQIWPLNHAKKNLHFCGHIIDCSPYYFAANTLVSCSRTEALPRNILEGKLAGLPVISTNIAGSVEAIGEYESATFYELGDIESLAKHIKNVGVKTHTKPNLNPDSVNLKYEIMLNDYFDLIKKEI